MKEIKIINYVFKFNNKINLISIEEYFGYQNENTKIKLLIDERFVEKEVRYTNHSPSKLVFDNLIITDENLELHIDDFDVEINVDNKELLIEFEKQNKGKNNYILFEEIKFYGRINGNEITGKLIIDFESIINISDDYYKMYCIDFTEFSGSFNMLAYDYKTPNIVLKYKDSEFKNKRVSNVKVVRLFKLSTYKIIVSGNYYWRINIKVNKTFKSNPSLIPFKYQKGTISLIMKKNVFKTNLDAVGKEILLISYKYI